MINPSKASMEELTAFMAKLAEVTALLFMEDPGQITQIDLGRAAQLGVIQQLYVSAVQLKNAMTMLFATGARSMGTGGANRGLVITASGDMDPKVMGAISLRFGANMRFPQFTVPLARMLRQHLAAGQKAESPLWQLHPGDGLSVFLEPRDRHSEPAAPHPAHEWARPVKFQ